jgi:hypothetical protein
MNFIINLYSREFARMICNRMQSSIFTILESTEPNAKSDAFASKKNGFEKSACIRIGADINAFLSVSKASLAFGYNQDQGIILWT